MRDEFCKDCKWWKDGTTYWGDCRRHGPEAQYGPMSPMGWPRTQRDAWCGDFETAEKPPRKLDPKTEFPAASTIVWEASTVLKGTFHE